MNCSATAAGGASGLWLCKLFRLAAGIDLAQISGWRVFSGLMLSRKRTGWHRLQHQQHGCVEQACSTD